MDTLTHTVIGACLGEAIAGKQMGKKAMFWGAVANNLPDIDVAVAFWTNETKTLLLHRGITHSILFAVVMTPLLAFALKKIYNKYPVTRSQWLLLVGSGLFIHIFIDALTTYGTGWFEPFSHYRVSLNTIFILDPIFTLPVLIASIALLVLKKDSTKRRMWWKAGLTLSALYMTFTIINKLYVNHVSEKNFKTDNIAFNDYMATPTPVNNFLWYIIARAGNKYYIGYYSLFDKNDIITFEEVPKNDSLLSLPCDPAQVADLMRFSKGYYCAKIENDTIIFSDMRFGQLGGWYRKNSPFIFNFKMAKNCSNRTALQKGRFGAFDKEAIKQLFKRIGGKE
jgi:inner membrane protein